MNQTKTEFFARQLEFAREKLKRDGVRALDNPSGATGRICGCGNCYCCAAAQVVREESQVAA